MGAPSHCVPVQRHTSTAGERDSSNVPMKGAFRAGWSGGRKTTARPGTAAGDTVALMSGDAPGAVGPSRRSSSLHAASVPHATSRAAGAAAAAQQRKRADRGDMGGAPG
jgi:hypothetical protein